MGYTSDEKDQAVQQLVQGRVAFSRDRLGPRDVGNSYNQLSELVNSALFYEPDGIFYLIYLSSNYYTRSVNTQLTQIDEALDAIDDLLKPNKPIEDVSSIGTARQALLGIDNAISRNGTVGEREYQRYTRSINRVRSSLGRAVKLAYTPRGSSQQVVDIVRPRAEARGILTNRFSSIKSGHQDILTAVELLLGAYAQFIAAPISYNIAQGQVSRAASALETLQDEMEALSPSARVEYARNGLLTTLANKATIRALANRVIPGDPKLEQEAGATAEYRLEAYGTGTAPSVTGAKSGPWDLVDGSTDELSFDINGTSGIVVDLNLNSAGYVPGATRAELRTGIQGPYAIAGALAAPHPLRTKAVTAGTGTYAVAGKNLYLTIDGIVFRVAFPAGPAPTAVGVANTIDVAITGYGNASVTTGGGLDYVRITWNNTTSPPAQYSSRYMQVGTGIDDASDLGPWEVLYDDPTSVAGTQTRGWDANNVLKLQVGDSSTVVTETLTSGAWPSYTRSASDVAGEIGGAGYDATTDGDTVVIHTDTTVGTEAFLAVRTDGLSGGYASTSLRTAQTLGLMDGQESRQFGVDARAVANTLNNDTNFSAEAVATVVREDLLKATNALYAASNQLSVVLPQYTDDPTDGWTFSELKLDIHSGDNRGSYLLSSSSWNPTTQTLTLTLNGRSLRDTTVTNRHQITVYKEFLKVASTDSSTSGSLKVNSTGAYDLIGFPTTTTTSTVNEVFIEHNDPALGWVAADLRQRHIKVGDTLVSGGVEVATISSVANIASGRLGVTDVSSQLSLDSTAGFSVESSAHRAYLDFYAALSSWKTDSLPPFTENLGSIDQKLNYVLNVDSPSRSQVNNAYASMESLKTSMEALKSVLDSFSVPSVGVLDRGLASLLEHGHDRARDLLLRGNLEAYFGATDRDASFSRSLMKAASTLTVEDLNQTTNMGDDRNEFDRYAGGWIDEYDPAYDFEDEDELPSSPLTSFWPGLETDL